MEVTDKITVIIPNISTLNKIVEQSLCLKLQGEEKNKKPSNAGVIYSTHFHRWKQEREAM